MMSEIVLILLISSSVVCHSRSHSHESNSSHVSENHPHPSNATEHRLPLVPVGGLVGVNESLPSPPPPPSGVQHRVQGNSSRPVIVYESEKKN